MTACAGDNTIAALLAGAIDSAAAQRLERHLDACATCRGLIAELGRGLSAVGERGPVGTHRLPKPGEHIGRYEIRGVVGAGGVGVVYEAWDATLARRVAVKVLRPDIDDATGACLLAEAQAMARLQHPNIVTVHDAGRAGEQLYVCMEFVTGTTLRSWISDARRPWREIARVFAAAGAGLAYVHRAGLVHLDFKPDNVLIDGEGRVRVGDFGGIALGTPAYMAPEQRRGDRADARSDQFAFCRSLHEALDGRAPGWVHALIARGMATDPRARFGSMDALLARLAAGLAPRRRGRAVGVVLLSAAAAALVVTAAPPASRVVTRLVDRPTQASRGLAALVAPSAGRPRTPRIDAGSEPVRVLAHASIDHAPRTVIAPVPRPSASARPARAARMWSALLASVELPARSAISTSTSDGDSDEESPTIVGATGDPAAIHACDDGTPLTCAYLAPRCPSGTIAAVHEQCWTCADAASCAPLGLPRTPPTSRGPRCGNRVCERGESARACARDCGGGGGAGSGAGSDAGSGGSGGSGVGSGAGTGSGDGVPTCGNGFCELGEDHPSCALDCCELAASGACASRCGNGFCELDEDHTSCALDCCELAPSGQCAELAGGEPSFTLPPGRVVD